MHIDLLFVSVYISTALICYLFQCIYLPMYLPISICCVSGLGKGKGYVDVSTIDAAMYLLILICCVSGLGKGKGYVDVSTIDAATAQV